MLRSMLSAASALRNHQTYMDVVANNIANINTTAYKASRATFNELLSQLVSTGSAPTAETGGTNPIQVGLGMSIGSVDNIMTQGSNNSTGRTGDLAIDGEGFYVYQGSTQDLYSRDGALELGLDGSLTNTASGLRIMGWNADANGKIDTTGALKTILIPLNQGLAQATSAITVSGNLNSALANRSVSSSETVTNTVNSFGVADPASGQIELTSGTYYVEVKDVTGGQQFRVVDASGSAVSIKSKEGTGYTSDWQALTAGTATYDTGRGLTVSFGTGTSGAYTTGTRGNGAASASYTSQSVSEDVSFYDSLGGEHKVTLTYTKDATNPNKWTWQATSSETGVTLTPATATTMTFGTSGQYADTNAAANLNFTFTNGAAAQTVGLKFTGLTQLAEDTSLDTPSQDGYAPGTITGYEVSTDGTVSGVYANGMRKVVAQLAIATFENSSGLLRNGDNTYSEWTNSGQANLGVAGSDGRGNIKSGYLEQSNVDLAQQFTNMITAQRGFQANSRVITASDQMLQDLVNLVR